MTLSDEERGLIRWAIAKGYYDHTAEDKVCEVIESIVAARERDAARRAWVESAVHHATCDECGTGVLRHTNPYDRADTGDNE